MNYGSSSNSTVLATDFLQNRFLARDMLAARIKTTQAER